MMEEVPLRQSEVNETSAALVSTSATVGLILATLLTSRDSSITSIAFILCSSMLVGAFVRMLMKAGDVVGITIVLLLAFAYLPSSSDAINYGFPGTAYRITETGVYRALAVFIGQLSITAGAAWFGARSSLTRAVVSPLIKSVQPLGARNVFLIVFGALLTAAFLGSVADGQWSSYAPGQKGVDEQRLAGGFRLALLYGTWLLGACSCVGILLVSARHRRSRLLWLSVAGVLLVLVFLVQGRRLIVSSIAVIVLPQLLHMPKLEGQSRRRFLLIASSVFVAGGLLYASLLWRTALGHGSKDTVSHLQGMAKTRVGAEDALNNLQSRLTYLWMDSAVMELGSRARDLDLLQTSFMGALATNTPGVLLPGKYKWRKISCENLLLRDPSGDLPCTAPAEGMLFGGTLGLLVVGLAWGLTVTFAAALYATHTVSGAALGAVALVPLTLIETSAFPILTTLRLVLATVLFSAPIVQCWRWLVARPSSPPPLLRRNAGADQT